jgi:hypothetical protein
MLSNAAFREFVSSLDEWLTAKFGHGIDSNRFDEQLAKLFMTLAADNGLPNAHSSTGRKKAKRARSRS